MLRNTDFFRYFFDRLAHPQPNGVRLKYENVSFTLSVGDVAKIQTAPKGNNSNTIVKAGKTAKQTFFMLYISFTNFDFSVSKTGIYIIISLTFPIL